MKWLVLKITSLPLIMKEIEIVSEKFLSNFLFKSFSNYLS